MVSGLGLQTQTDVMRLTESTHALLIASVAGSSTGRQQHCSSPIATSMRDFIPDTQAADHFG